MNDSPFLLLKIECPVCKTLNEFESVKVGAYIEGGRDSDFCPIDITWRHSRYQAYHPLVFFTGTCSNCFYTRELTQSFKEWKSDNQYRTYRLKTIKDKHLDEIASADSWVKMAGQAIDTSRFPNESGILRLILAIYDETLGEHFSKLDVGRFYLRIAWLFRVLELGENPNLSFAKGLLSEVDKKYQSLKGSVASCREELAVFSRHLNKHIEAEEISADLRARMNPFQERFSANLEQYDEQFKMLSQHMAETEKLIADYRSAVHGGSESSSGGSFNQSGSFVDFLIDLKRHWNGVVVSEREALIEAVSCYKEAFSEARDIQPGNQQLQASYLIAELSRRIGDYESAKQYFNTTIKAGQDFVYRNRQDQARTALARKILELAIEQGRATMEASRSTSRPVAV
jgi:uncharacterized protein (DUF2225 family)